MQAGSRKTLLIAILIVFSLAQVYTTFMLGGGGIIAKYGFWDAFPAFFSLSWGDPLLAAGLVDFMMVAGFALVWMLADLPSEKRWGPRTWLWLVSFAVFPGLGMLLYFLWLHPEHRLMRG